MVCTALLAVAVASLALAGPAAAKLTGNYTKFAQCPFTDPEARKCLYAVTEGGEVVLGKKKVPIVNPVVLQGAAGPQNEESFFANFIAATNGETLSKAPQPVPGGLAGLINCKEISNFLLRASCELAFENGLTGVNSTLELAKPPSEILLNEGNLGGEEGVALQMPVKVHLENPFLGESCYVGSSGSPIIWQLTAGTTNPPEPNKPITGTAGIGEFFENGRVLVLKNAVLVDNAWSAPGASGCGGLFSFLIDPIINATAGVPAAAGLNTAILKNTINVASVVGVKKNNEENP
jgi:hypothetical protein